MTDHPRFNRRKGDFEPSYHDYYGAPVVDVILHPSFGVERRRTGRGAGVLLVVLSVIAFWGFALGPREAIGLASASERSPASDTGNDVRWSLK